ncbi:MAG: hypothetical protein MZV63_07270 [Marinilabiliales bacterium]|nr:hypothetical protein [Marinilabiliales bacterium]
MEGPGGRRPAGDAGVLRGVVKATSGRPGHPARCPAIGRRHAEADSTRPVFCPRPAVRAPAQPRGASG